MDDNDIVVGVFLLKYIQDHDNLYLTPEYEEKHSDAIFLTEISHRHEIHAAK